MIWSGKYRELIQERIKARKEKDFVKADEIKKVLEKEGMEIREDGLMIYCLWGPKGSFEQEFTLES